MVQLLSAAAGSSESLTMCQTQAPLFARCGAARSSNCSTSASIQGLEKSNVASQQNSFYGRLAPLHWTLCVLSRVLTLRESLLTTVTGAEAEDGPAGLQRGCWGAPEVMAAALWQGQRKNREIIDSPHESRGETVVGIEWNPVQGKASSGCLGGCQKKRTGSVGTRLEEALVARCDITDQTWIPKSGESFLFFWGTHRCRD